MKINNVEVIGNRFAYDGCHKIYVIENQEDEQKSRECGYEILDISQLIKTYNGTTSRKRTHKIDKF